MAQECHALQETKALFLVSTIIFVFIRYFIAAGKSDHEFSIGATALKYHANWTTSLDSLNDLKEFHAGLMEQRIQEIDVSFAMSSGLGISDLSKIIPAKLKSYKKVKLNFGNIHLETRGADYIASLISNGVEELELYFDSAHLDNGFGKLLGERLSELTSLKKLKVSLILCGMND